MGRTFYIVRFTMIIKLWSVFPRSHLSRWAGNRIFLVSSDEETWWPDAGIEGHGEVDESSLGHRTLIHILILTVGRLHKQFRNCWVLPVTTWAFLQFIGSTDMSADEKGGRYRLRQRLIHELPTIARIIQFLPPKPSAVGRFWKCD